MKSFFLCLAYLQFNFRMVYAEDKDFSKLQPSTTFITWTKHLQYTAGAFGGAMVGSFFINAFDTIAARKFALIKTYSWRATAKSVITSYIPIIIGVVPMRALAFGIYSICQDLFSNYLSFEFNKMISAALSGFFLALLTTPAEVLKTRRQVESKITDFNIRDLKGSFIPLALRVIPTATCMLAGTEGIQTLLPANNNIFLSTAVASFIASSFSQIVGTPAENIRIYRVTELAYQPSTIDLIKKIKFLRLYTGFWHRSLALGIQATFTLVSAKLAS